MPVLLKKLIDRIKSKAPAGTRGWTREEEWQLLALSMNTSLSEIRDRVGKSDRDILIKLAELARRNFGRKDEEYRPWTETHISWVIRFQGTQTIQALSAWLGRSEEQVRYVAEMLTPKPVPTLTETQANSEAGEPLVIVGMVPIEVFKKQQTEPERPARSGKRWTELEDKALLNMRIDETEAVAEELGRSHAAVLKRSAQLRADLRARNRQGSKSA